MSATSVPIFNCFGFFLHQLDVWVWGTSVTSGSNETCELAGWAWAGSSCLAHCLPPSVRRLNSWLQTRLQLGFRSLSLAVGVKKHLLIWAVECGFVSVAPNQSSAGKLEWVHCDLLTVGMKGVICPSVCSFIDKPHWAAWQGHLHWRIVCVVTLFLEAGSRDKDAYVVIKIVRTASTVTCFSVSPPLPW